MPESVAKNDAGKPDILPDMGPHIDRLKPGRLRHEVKRTDADPAEHRIDESVLGSINCTSSPPAQPEMKYGAYVTIWTVFLNRRFA